MFLFRDVMDKQLVDRHGHKAGKVDDIVLEMRPGRPPAVRAIVSGRGSVAPILSSRMARTVSWLQERLLGKALAPAKIDWNHVTRIDVAVHLDLDRQEAHLTQTEDALWERWIRHLPWAER